MIAVDQSNTRRGRREMGFDDNAKVAGWRYGTASCAVAARRSSRDLPRSPALLCRAGIRN
jgi:hypothetical protein